MKCGLKSRLGPCALAAMLCAATAPAHATRYYWDINGSAAGAGGLTPAGTWSENAAHNYWSTSEPGTSGTIAWSNFNNRPNDAVFAAGDDATGAYNVLVQGSIDLRNLVIQEGQVTFNKTISADALRLIATSTGNLGAEATWTINGGGAVIHSQLNLNGNTLIVRGGGDLTVHGDFVGNVSGFASNLTLATTYTGTIRLNANATPSGTTTIGGGTLLINGLRGSGGNVLFGAITSDATLGGDGKLWFDTGKSLNITGQSSSAMAILAPGDPLINSGVGSLEVATALNPSAVVFGNFSEFLVDVRGAEADLLKIFGHLTVHPGATISFNVFEDAPPTAEEYLLLSFTGTGTNWIDGFIESGLPTGYMLDYRPGSSSGGAIYLMADPNYSPPVETPVVPLPPGVWLGLSGIFALCGLGKLGKRGAASVQLSL